MECTGFFYETLGSLEDGGGGRRDDDPQAPTSDSEDQSDAYVVLRNQISLSSPPCPSADSAAADYFSLDVNDGGGGDESNPSTAFSTPHKGAGSPAATPQQGTERTLESGWFQGRSQLKSPMLQLHKEILDFCDFLSPTPEEQASRSRAIDDVFNVIKYIWPNCEVEIFGSFRTGLYLPTSDVDVVILESNIRTPQIGLVALSRALSQKGIAKNMQVIGKARVPIIKFVEKRSGIAFDISFDIDNGPKAAEYIKDALSRWPPLRPLCLILKIFLHQRELNEVYSGGVGSYALLVMLIAMLRSIRECQAFPENNLGILLVNFFEFYGRKLNTFDVGVSCDGPGTFFMKSNRGFLTKGRPFLISIQDPQVPDNDIGKNSFNYFQVRSAFITAFQSLTNTKTILGLGPNRSILGTIIRPDQVLLERKGGSNGEVTFNSLLPGVGEPLQLQQCQNEMLGNWRLDDAEEEPLPRGNGVLAGSSMPKPSIKKRKGKEKVGKGVKENGEALNSGNEENGSRKGKSHKRRHWRNNRGGDGSNSNGPYGGNYTWNRSA